MKMLSKLPLFKRQQLLKERQAQARRALIKKTQRLKVVESREPGDDGKSKGKGGG